MIDVTAHSKLLLSNAQDRIEQAVPDDAREQRQREEAADHHGSPDEATYRRHRRDVAKADRRDGDQPPPEPITDAADLVVGVALHQEQADTAENRLRAEHGERKGE